VTESRMLGVEDGFVDREDEEEFDDEEEGGAFS